MLQQYWSGGCLMKRNFHICLKYGLFREAKRVFRLMEKIQMAVKAFAGTSRNFQRFQELCGRVRQGVFWEVWPHTMQNKCWEGTAN